MRPRAMVWIGCFLALVLIAFGLWWLIGHVSGMPGYKLVIVLAALTGFVFNHLRWWGLSRKAHEPDTFEKISILIVSNYVVLLLVLALVDFHR